MPELPSITVYVESIERHLVGHTLETIRVSSPFLLRSVDPPLSEVHGSTLVAARRMGKRIVFEFEKAAGESIFLVLHLMIAGRLRLRSKGAKLPGKRGLAAFDFDHKTVVLTEASTKKRAKLHVVGNAAGVADHDPGGLELAGAKLADFKAALTFRNHTLKRALTDPHLISGIGNAYSDEILFRARLSPFKQTQKLSDDEWARLFATTTETLDEWVAILRNEVGDGFPDKVTAFHDQMAVHGRYGKPCLECDKKVQRIRYAENEANYCATCQTAGKLLADRSLSRLLKKDWPKTIDELERRKADYRRGE